MNKLLKMVLLASSLACTLPSYASDYGSENFLTSSTILGPKNIFIDFNHSDSYLDTLIEQSAFKLGVRYFSQRQENLNISYFMYPYVAITKNTLVFPFKDDLYTYTNTLGTQLGLVHHRWAPIHTFMSLDFAKNLNNYKAFSIAASIGIGMKSDIGLLYLDVGLKYLSEADWLDFKNSSIQYNKDFRGYRIDSLNGFTLSIGVAF